MEQYKIKSDGGIIRASDGANIPPDLNNKDYIAFKTWESQGNTPETENFIDCREIDDALNFLRASDIVILRCIESGTEIPQEWKSYREKLRDIVSGRTEDLIPLRPDFPGQTQVGKDQ